MKENAYLCPSCGNPAVERSPLAGGSASCKACPWKGRNEELVVVPFEHNFASPEQVMERFAAEFSSTIARHLAAPLGAVLFKWGFISKEDLATDLLIYIRAIAAASAKAVLETRDGISTGKIKREPSSQKAVKKGLH